jgi:nicotinamidase-related amidase
VKLRPQVLLLVDYQRAFEAAAVRAIRSNPDAEVHAASLIAAWRAAGWPVVHVRHDSTEAESALRPDHTGNAPMAFAVERAGEPVLRKQVNSAFVGTDLAERLIGMGRPDVVVAGLTTDHCVSTTVRMGANLGFRMMLAADACFTVARPDAAGTLIPAEEVHRVAVASLIGEFATVKTAAELVAGVAASQQR